MARIVWTLAALRHLENIVEYIAADNPEAAAMAADRIDAALHRLHAFPESAPVYREPLRRFHVPGLPISCYYSYSNEVVRILYLRHDQQSPLQ